MSAQLVALVLEDPIGDHYTDRQRRPLRSVFLVLAEFANRDGVAWPSTTTIGARTCMSPRTVRRHLTELERAGRIAPVAGRAGGRMKSTRWRVTPEKGGHGRPGFVQVKAVTDDHVSTQETGTRRPENPVTGGQETRPWVATEPRTEPNPEVGERAASSLSPNSGCSPHDHATQCADAPGLEGPAPGAEEREELLEEDTPGWRHATAVSSSLQKVARQRDLKAAQTRGAS